MDTALVLKIKFEKNELHDFRQAKAYYKNSEILQKLLSDFEINVLNLLWRLSQLSELPFAGEFKEVKEWINKLIKITYTGNGFSLTGKDDYLVPCYNGMIVSLLIKLAPSFGPQIKQGIEWIIKYQHVQKGQHCEWQGPGIKKYGGCLKNTPCYIGLVKSMIAISDYKKSNLYTFNEKLEKKLNQGLEYILDHEIYKKQSDKNPITKDITKITYPFTWKTNIIEILRLIKDNGLLSDPRCNPAKDFLMGKREKDNYWQTRSVSILKNKTWVPFDKIKGPGNWISHEINKLVDYKLPGGTH